MTIALRVLATGISFLVLLLIFRPLEKCFPAKSKALLRPAWFTDLAFFLGQYLIWTGLVFAVLAGFGQWLGQFVPSSCPCRFNPRSRHSLGGSRPSK